MKIEIRPWGTFMVLHESPDFKVKKLTVHPWKALSLQSHGKREEHWIGLHGSGHAIIGGKKHDVFPNSQHHIPIGTQHRLINDTAIPLTIVEIQTGEYFGEDDITRYEDRYGRK